MDEVTTEEGERMEEPLRPPTPPPEASQEALEYLKSISPKELEEVMFTDNLVTISDTGKELGEFTITVEPAKYDGQDCLLVHANSHGTIDNVPMGTSVTAHVSKSLQTLEQQHHEYVKLEDNHLDRKTFLTLQDGQYVVNRTVAQGENVTRTSQTYSLDVLKGFISEGSNLILQRIMIRRNADKKVNLDFISFDSEAFLCQSTYQTLEDKNQQVDDTEITVHGIERTVLSKKDLPTSWQSYFLSDGHMSSRVQVGSPVMMRLLHLPAQTYRDETNQKPPYPKKQINWEEDMQLYSKFLDRKEELKGDHATYMRRHPELKALLADFLQFLLLRKPEDVVAFAADYFASFSATTKPGSAYATSREARFIPRSESPFKKNPSRSSSASVS